MQGDMPEVVERPPDEHVIGLLATYSHGLVEQRRTVSRISLAPIDLSETDERDRDHPPLVELRLLADRQRLFDQGSRTKVVAAQASEAGQAQQRPRKIAELPVQSQALGEAPMRLVLVSPCDGRTAGEKQHPRAAPKVTEPFEERPGLAHRASCGVRIGAPPSRANQR